MQRRSMLALGAAGLALPAAAYGARNAGARGEPLMLFRSVRGAFVHGCCAPPQTAAFLAVEGEDSAAIRLVGNALDDAAKPVETRHGATPDAVTVGS